MLQPRQHPGQRRRPALAPRHPHRCIITVRYCVIGLEQLRVRARLCLAQQACDGSAVHAVHVQTHQPVRGTKMQRRIRQCGCAGIDRSLALLA